MDKAVASFNTTFAHHRRRNRPPLLLPVWHLLILLRLRPMALWTIDPFLETALEIIMIVQNQNSKTHIYDMTFQGSLKPYLIS
jgi:hypothetical protein